jgi:hypothetical protein
MATADFRISLDTSQAREAYKKLKTNASKAIMRALNRTMENGQTVAVRETAQDLGLRQDDVRDAFTIERATPVNLRARLIARGARIPLIKFGATGPEPSRGKGGGVSYRLPGSRGRHPRAFIATMRSGHRGVFVRLRRSRLPIAELFGPSIPRAFTKQLPAIQARVAEMLPKNLDHEVQFALRESAAR